MAVKVKDLLKLKLFSSAKVVAGVNGLEKEINRINFSDCPVMNDTLDLELVMAGDFYINSMYIVKDDVVEMKRLFDLYINSSSSGVCVIDEFVKELPNEIKKYADYHDFPVILIDTNVPYAEIIRICTEMILLEQADIISEMRLDKLLEEKISKDEVVSTAVRINRSFKAYYTVVYIYGNTDKESINLIRKELNANYDFEAIKYRGNILLIINTNKSVMFPIHLDYAEKVIGKYCKDYVMGISNPFEYKEDFNYCLRQSIAALELSSISIKKRIYYKDLNIYKFLYPARNDRYLLEFYNEIFQPLQTYDEYYNADIINTLETFLDNEGDYKKTSHILHQHENTVRYRILKAKKLLDLEKDPIKFIEQTSLAIKIHKILKINKTKTVND
ncbi:MAG: PucR family transcriptional regulator ligand-binding domain-containing protein [Tissierellales bacterium]|nr:PucR family transcriptional regulator ligand-binding domain-containing protein [Tissierellales bacterium]